MKSLLKINLILLFNVIILKSAGQTTTNKVETVTLGNKKIHLKRISSNVYKENATSLSDQSLAPIPITKHHAVLKLPLQTGKFIFLKDVGKLQNDDVNAEVYHLKGMLRNRFYVLTIQYYESQEYLLIDNTTGQKVKLLGTPIVSEDGSCIASFSASLDYDEMPNGIQVYHIDNGKIALLWEYIIKDWQPDEVKWKDDHTLLVLKEIPDYLSPSKHSVKSYLELSF